MDVLGILCLGFMAIYFINGCRKGFFVNLIESIKAIGVIILAIVFCETLGNYLLEGSVGASIIDTLKGVLSGLNSGFDTIVTQENKDLLMSDYWNYVPISGALDESCQALVNMYIDAEVGMSFGYYVAKSLAHYVTISIGFVGIIVVGNLAVSIILFILKRVNKKQSGLSRLLGGLIGIVRGFIFVSIACYVLGIIYSMNPDNSFGSFIGECLNNEVGIFKWFYENNLINYIINNVLTNL